MLGKAWLFLLGWAPCRTKRPHFLHLGPGKYLLQRNPFQHKGLEEPYVHTLSLLQGFAFGKGSWNNAQITQDKDEQSHFRAHGGWGRADLSERG